MHERHLEAWESGERVLVLLDNTPASEVAVRRAWRLAHAFNTELVACYPAPLLAEQGMGHILTVAADLNATVVKIDGEDLAGELGALVTEHHIGHVTLIAAAGGGLPFRRRSLAERLLALHPHLDIHLVGSTRP